MPGIARHGDYFQSGTGKGNIVASATKTFVNGIKIARVGDVCPHWHLLVFLGGATIVEGSTTVFAEGRRVARIGDALNCGCTIREGSTDTFAE